MNLTTDPWIPVVYGDGDARDVSLVTLFEDAGRIRDLAVNPPQRVSLMRLLICITQRALDGPGDERDWYGSRDRIRPVSLDYLDAHRDCFDLYGDRAFLQARGLKPTDNAVVDKLDFRLSAGNNPTLFDQDAQPGGRPLNDAVKALLLLTYQCYSPGGLIGESIWNGRSTGRSSEQAPCVESSILHTLIVGPVLLDSIHMNLLTKKMVDNLPFDEFGVPIWEMPAISPDDPAVDTVTGSYLGRLVPMTRGILLKPDSPVCTLVNGLSYPKFPESREVSGTVFMRKNGKKEEPAYQRVNLDKHPWRIISSLLMLSGDGEGGGAVVLEHLVRLGELGHDENVSIWTGGLGTNKSKILDAGEWLFTFRPAFLSNESQQQYNVGAGGAEKASGVLGYTVNAYCQEMKMENTLAAKARKRFWSILDTRYEILIDAATAGEALDDTWYPVVRKAMEEAYEYACPHTTPRQIQAYALGIKRLRLKKFNDTAEVV